MTDHDTMADQGFADRDPLQARLLAEAAHVQLDVQPATPATFALVLDGIARFRAARPPV